MDGEMPEPTDSEDAYAVARFGGGKDCVVDGTACALERSCEFRGERGGDFVYIAIYADIYLGLGSAEDRGGGGHSILRRCLG